MLAGVVDELCILLAPRRIEQQGVLLNHHLRKADDGIERRSQFVAHGGEKPVPGGVGAFGCGSRQFQRVLLMLSLGDITHHGNDFGFFGGRCGGDRLERTASHFHPYKVRRMARLSLGTPRELAPEPEFDALRVVAERSRRKRGEIGRAVGHVDPLEQAVVPQFRYGHAKQNFRGRRNELHGAIALVARNHVAHVARQQAIATFLDVQQRDSGARQRLGAERNSRGIQRRGRNAGRHQDAVRRRTGVERRQDAEVAHRDQREHARDRKRRCKPDDAAGGGQRGFQWNQGKPDRHERSDSAGRNRDHHDKAGERDRRQHVRGFITAGPRQEIGEQNRNDEPGERQHFQRRRRTADRKIDGKRRECDEASQETRSHERPMARSRQRIVSRRRMQQGVETILNKGQCSHVARASADVVADAPERLHFRWRNVSE